ncbi:DUF1440 domain-containing protein [Flavobacterium humi]|uniref:DUF1440 domain-containing protein n=1 Tax=Flavobacterium humi TaxID=2562683 RepID=A0A4Z0LAB1_9FLAO|nr:DUF1440 domain-containing protein [Flavobacterium humi]TGD58592.1 DUF1440 domain-containing protein [Flavobacterium humi]
MWKSILQTTLFVGTLDILAACLNAYLSAHVTPGKVLQYIASGIFGDTAFSGGASMMLFGLLFHFVIAFACTAVFYWLYPKIPFFKFSLTVNAILIAVVAWLVTTRLVIPMSRITPPPFDFVRASVSVFILIVCIGIPIAYQSKRFYQEEKQ